MKRQHQANLRRLTGKSAYHQQRIATCGTPYADDPAAYDLALVWLDNLDYVKTHLGGKLPIFKPSGKPGTPRHSVIEVVSDVIDMVHVALESGNANQLRRFADSLEALHAQRPDADPLRAAMLHYAAYRIGPKYYSTKPPLAVPFTETECTAALAEMLLSAPDPTEVRRAAKQLGWTFKPAKRGRPKLGL